MAYSQDEIDGIFEGIISDIEEGSPIRTILAKDGMPSNKVFYKWIDEDEEKRKRYARACEERADKLFEDILTIVDDQEGDVYYDKDGNECTNHNVIQRSRLRMEARKWMVSKMNPKKYGESSLLKLGDNEGNELKINAIFSTDLLHVPTNEST